MGVRTRLSNKPILLRKMEEILKRKCQLFTIRQMQNELREIKSDVERLTIDEYAEILFLEDKIMFIDQAGNSVSLIKKKLQEYEKPLKMFHKDNKKIISDLTNLSSDYSDKEKNNLSLNFIKINCMDFFSAILRNQFDNDLANNVFVKIYEIIDRFSDPSFFRPSYYSVLIFEQFFNKQAEMQPDPNSTRRNDLIDEILKSDPAIYPLKEKIKALFDLFCALNSTGYIQSFMTQHKTFVHINNRFFNSQEDIKQGGLNHKQKLALIKKKYISIEKEILVVKMNEDMKFSDRMLYYPVLEKIVDSIKN